MLDKIKAWWSVHLKGWRTIAINIAMGIVPVLQLTEWRDVLPPAYLPWYALGMALVNLGLRKITTTPVGKKV